ncbi:MAG: LCP family protein, partial [Candidatus Limnocylindrales bacterium]
MSRVPLGLASTVLCLALFGCTGLATGAGEQEPPRQPAKGAPAAERARAASTPEPTPPPLQVANLLGQDGRLTVLILGSDLRKGIPGERTDAIIVATIDPASGEVAMVSLPRDTVNVPIAPGKVYSGRINALLGDYQRSSGKKKVALNKLRETLGYAFDIEIDYYAMVDFSGLVRLVDSIGGVRITLADPFIDPTMHLSSKGLRLKAGTQLLSGKEALAYTRS